MRSAISLLIALFLSLPALCPPGNPLSIPSVRVPPVIDGTGDDSCWDNAAELSFPGTETGGGAVDLKICFSESRIFVLAVFDAEKETRTHSPWRWEASSQTYYCESSVRETELCLLLSPSKKLKSADLWIWRSARTDPSGLAEDAVVTAAGISGTDSAARFSVRYDTGEPCWHSRYFAKFAGPALPRFYQKKASGSRSDVSAKGRWENGRWTVEFARKLDTGHPDDLRIPSNAVFHIGAFISTPSRESLAAADTRPLFVPERVSPPEDWREKQP